MSRNLVEEHIEENFESYLNDLIRLISQPSISTTSEGVEECTKLVQRLCQKYGFDEINKIETSGQPSIIAKAFVDHDPENEQPTLLIYGHYDVQPVDPKKWTTPPFEPDIREEGGEERIYARGAGDNKGQWFAHLCAVEALREKKNLPMNVTLLLEGEEEMGSPHLRQVIEENKSDINADLAYISDGPIDESDRPQVVLGVRGLLYVEIQAKGADRDLHSGIFGGPAPNPAWELVRILDSMKDEKGEITIDGFYDDILKITEEDREVLQRIPLDESKIRQDLGIKGFAEGPGESYHEKLMYYPTLNIPGFTSGYGSEGIKTIIPSEAKVKVDMRLVADQDPGDIFQKFSEHVKKHESGTVDLDIIYHDSMKPYRMALDSPYIEPMMNAVKYGWQDDPVLKPAAGGSLPSYVFSEVLDIDCIVVPYANADENNHSPDENLVLKYFKNGIKTTSRILENLSDF
ncbi:MAG: M20/M25/M40 family metallo-hydrolase [Candidatus Thermoplasmatota archaeon]|nr:M20/M25/M40 family metallo-hydrolase [Candidatus Thermoplasmatota archaeon]MBS3790291.1 M20/M25/M40 family metallo-hydrolase [Candidatus Thermoplasmatota archaeon]